MERVNRICKHPLWNESLKQIEQAEADRIFCGHDLTHFLDVARLAYIEALEKKLDVPKEWIYAAALLHDIGRHRQYQDGIPHEQASAEIAKEILHDCGFDREAQEQILQAVGGHRNAETISMDTLEGLLYRADKQSRNCLFCPAVRDCNWSDEKKNWNLLV